MRWSVWVVRGLSMHGLGGDVMEMLEGVSRGSQPFFKKQAELHGFAKSRQPGGGLLRKPSLYFYL